MMIGDYYKFYYMILTIFVSNPQKQKDLKIHLLYRLHCLIIMTICKFLKNNIGNIFVDMRSSFLYI